MQDFAQSNGLIFYETSSLWERDRVDIDNERGGIGTLIRLMSVGIVKDIISENPYAMHSNKTSSVPGSAY